jgi:hypothetical protein
MGRMTYFIFEPTVPSLRIRRIPTFFELRTLSPKTLKSVNFTRGSEKEAKNSYGSYPTEWKIVEKRVFHEKFEYWTSKAYFKLFKLDI